MANDDLITTTQRLAARERGTTAELVAHLAELEARDLHLAAGYSSMFSYCCEVLRLSEHEAYNRIEVARAARRFPVILDLLIAGDLTLTTVRLLAPHLTESNHAAVLASARALKKTEVEQLVAKISPRPDAPTTLRRLPTAERSTSDTTSTIDMPPMAAPAPSPRPILPKASEAAVVTSLAPERYKLQLTISGAILEKLRLAQDLLRHAVPDGDEAALLERALDALLADLVKKKFAASDRPRPRRPEGIRDEPSRHVPGEVKRAVYLATAAGARMWPAAGIDATSARSSSFITSIPMPTAGRPR